MKEILEILEEVIIRLEDMNVSGDNWGQSMMNKLNKAKKDNGTQ